MKGDADEAGFGAEDPFGIRERRGEPFLAVAVRLMARAADGEIKLFAGLETGLLFGGERRGGWTSGNWFAGP